MILGLFFSAIPISSCGVIDQPGEYYLTRDIIITSADQIPNYYIWGEIPRACLVIKPGVHNVVLNCEGHKIINKISLGIHSNNAIAIAHSGNLKNSHIQIKNCNIEGFVKGIIIYGQNGIRVENTTIQTENYGFTSQDVRAIRIITSYNVSLENIHTNSVIDAPIYSRDIKMRNITAESIEDIGGLDLANFKLYYLQVCPNSTIKNGVVYYRIKIRTVRPRIKNPEKGGKGIEWDTSPIYVENVEINRPDDISFYERTQPYIYVSGSPQKEALLIKNVSGDGLPIIYIDSSGELNKIDHSLEYAEIILGGISNATLQNIEFRGGYGFFVFDSNNVIFKNITFKNVSRAFHLRKSQNITIKDSYIHFYSGTPLLAEFMGDRSSSVIIFNNIFYFDLSPYPSNYHPPLVVPAYWKYNTTKSPGPNIVGGPFIGGNAWLNSRNNGYSQICKDADHDGFCDDPYKLNRYGTSATDYLPLSYSTKASSKIFNKLQIYLIKPTNNFITTVSNLIFSYKATSSTLKSFKCYIEVYKTNLKVWTHSMQIQNNTMVNITHIFAPGNYQWKVVCTANQTTNQSEMRSFVVLPPKNLSYNQTPSIAVGITYPTAYTYTRQRPDHIAWRVFNRTGEVECNASLDNIQIFSSRAAQDEWSFNYTIPEGRHKITVKCAGPNVAEDSVEFAVDTQPPKVFVSPADKAVFTASETIPLEVTAFDEMEASFCRIRLLKGTKLILNIVNRQTAYSLNRIAQNPALVQTLLWEQPTHLTEGDYKIIGECYDAVGHATTVTHSFSVKAVKKVNKPPKLSINLRPTDDKMYLDWNYTDETPGTIIIDCNITSFDGKKFNKHLEVASQDRTVTVDDRWGLYSCQARAYDGELYSDLQQDKDYLGIVPIGFEIKGSGNCTEVYSPDGYVCVPTDDGVVCTPTNETQPENETNITKPIVNFTNDTVIVNGTNDTKIIIDNGTSRMVLKGPHVRVKLNPGVYSISVYQGDTLVYSTTYTVKGPKQTASQISTASLIIVVVVVIIIAAAFYYFKHRMSI